MLTIEKHSIFDKCPDYIKKALLYYCDAINNSDADLFVVMAHKAVCLFQLLIEEGLIRKDIHDKYISNNALDYGIELKRKKILIVDDILISGSGVALVVNHLIKLGACENDINILILVKNLDYGGISFLREDKSNMLHCEYEASDEYCIRVSYEIACIFARLGICYDADFPRYRERIISVLEQKQLLSSLFGDLYNITNENHRYGNINVITLFPNEFLLQKVWNYTGINLNEFFDVKLRLFFHDYPQEICSLNIVPLALLKEASEKEIDQIVGIIKLQKNECLIDFNMLEYRAKVRLIQFYISHCVACVLFNLMDWGKPEIVYDSIRILFGFSTSLPIYSCLCEIREGIDSFHIAKEPFEPDMLGYKDVDDCDKCINNHDLLMYDGNYINDTLYRLIKYWDIATELPARERLKTDLPNYNKIEGVLEQTIYRKLNYGFSFTALMAHIKSVKDYYNIQHLVSLFIDRGIDEGITVPILQHIKERHLLCRSYRHGEDLPFGEADKIRLLYYLDNFAKYLEDKGLPPSQRIAEISFEKIIVFFYQIGLKRGIFNRFLGFNNDPLLNDPLLQERFCVHGAVRTVSTNAKERIFVEKEYDENSKAEKETLIYLSSLCQGDNEEETFISRDGKFFIIEREKIRNYLSKSKKNNYNQSEFLDYSVPLVNSLDEQLKDEISDIANTVGAWYYMEYRNNNLAAFKDDITCFTSCFDLFTFASCMATALHYFKLYWEKEASKHLQSIINGSFGGSFDSALFSQTFPSARDKHAWYCIDYINNIINKVKRYFETDSRLAVELRSWKKICSKPLSDEGQTNIRDLSKEAVEFVYIYSVIYEWLKSGRILQKDIPEKYGVSENFYYNLNRLYEIYKDERLIQEKERLQFFVNEVEENIHTIEQKTRIKDRCSDLINRVNSYLEESEDIVDKIEDSIQNHSHEYTFEYNSCIIITVSGLGIKDSNDFFRIIWNMIPETL